MASTASGSSNQGSTEGFGSSNIVSFNSSSNGSGSFATENLFEPEPVPAPAAAKPAAAKKIKLREGPSVGQKRAAEAAAARVAAEAAKAAKAEPKAPNASSLPAPPKSMTPSNKGSRKNKNKKSVNSNNAVSIASTEANIGFNKPHLRKVETNNGDTVSTSVGSNAFENSTGSASEGEREAADAKAAVAPPSPNAGNNRGLNNLELPTDADFQDVSAADIESETEAPEVANQGAQPITQMADPTMYLLLRVGTDSASEYIELRKQPIASMGTFNTHSIGSTKEIQNLYGIRTSEGYKAMQRAFGVPRYGKKAPFDDYVYVKQCKFRGFDLVREALQQRIRTLEESIRIANQGTINSNRNKHFLDILKKMVEGMASVRKVCAPEPAKPAAAAAAATQTNAKGPEGCPCLEDLSLLRDLVFLVAMIQGTTIPEVKKQLEAIPLNRLLNAAAKPEEKKTIIQQALEALKTVSIADKVIKANEASQTNTATETNTGVGTDAATTSETGVGTNEPVLNAAKLQEVLRSIWKALTKEDRTTDVTQEEIIQEIEALLARVAEYEASKQRCEEMGRELDDLRKRYMALQELLAKVEPGGENDDPFHEIERLGDELHKASETADIQAKELASLRDQLAAQEAKLTQANLNRSTNKAASNAATAAIQAEADSLRAQLAEQDSQSKAVQAELNLKIRALVDALEAFARASEGAKQQFAEELGATFAEVSGLQQALAECQAEKSRLIAAGANSDEATKELNAQLRSKDEQLQGLQHELAGKVGELAASAQKIRALEKERNNAKETVGERDRQLNESREQLGEAGMAANELKREIAGLRGQIEALEESHRVALEECLNQKAVLQGQLMDKTAEAAVSDKLVQELGAALEEAEIKAARANAAEAHSTNLEEQLASTSARLAAEAAAADEAKAEHETQLADISAKLAGARERLGQLEADIGDAKTASDAQTTELEGLRKHIRSLEAELAGTKSSGSAAEKQFAAAKASLDAEIAGYKAALAEAQEEIDGIPAIEQEKMAVEDALKAAEARVKSLVQQISTVEAEKDTITRNLTAKVVQKNANIQAKQAEHDTQIADLTQQLGEANAALETAKAEKVAMETKMAELGASQSAVLGSKNVLIGQLQENRKNKHRQIQNLQKQVQELEGLKETSASKNKTIASQNQQISALEAALAAAQEASVASSGQLTEKDAEIKRLQDALTAAQLESESSLTSKQGELEAIRQQLADAQEALKKAIEADAAKDAEREAAIKECEERLARELSKEKAARSANEAAALEKARKAAEAAAAELARLKAEHDADKTKQQEQIDRLRAEIATLLEQVAAAQRQVEEMTAAAKAEVDKLKEQLEAALQGKNIAEKAGLKAVTEHGEEWQTKYETLKEEGATKLAELQAQFDALERELETAISSEKERTRQRLQTLLAMIVVNKTMQEKAMAWWDEKGSAEEIESAGDEILQELCDFFTYLSGLLNMQMSKLNATSLPADAKLDILKIFKELPRDMPDDKELLKEITILFQELFVKVGKTTNIVERVLDKEYPKLHVFLSGFSIEGGAPLRENSRGYGAELGSFNFMTNTGIIPVAGKKLEMVRGTMDQFTINNTNHYVPLIVFGIKLIQLLSKSVNQKYGDLKQRCGGEKRHYRNEAARILAAVNSDDEE